MKISEWRNEMGNEQLDRIEKMLLKLTSPDVDYPNKQQVIDLLHLLANGRMIEIIRTIRGLTGLGFPDSKQLVDALDFAAIEKVKAIFKESTKKVENKGGCPKE